MMVEDPRGLTRVELLALRRGDLVEVLLSARTYLGPLIDPRSGWVPATVAGVGETMNGEVDLWADIAYPAGYQGCGGSPVHQQHWTADSTNVRRPTG